MARRVLPPSRPSISPGEKCARSRSICSRSTRSPAEPEPAVAGPGEAAAPGDGEAGGAPGVAGGDAPGPGDGLIVPAGAADSPRGAVDALGSGGIALPRGAAGAAPASAVATRVLVVVVLLVLLVVVVAAGSVCAPQAASTSVTEIM